MRFADIENVWTVDVRSLSNADLARVYYERAKHVVVKILAKPCEQAIVIRTKKVRRSYVVWQIGCQPAVTAQNPKIRALLLEADRSLCNWIPPETEGNKGGAGDSSRSASFECAPAANVPPLGRIVFTDVTCVIKELAYPDIPTLVWPEGIDEAASDWLRHVVVDAGLATSSAKEYAKILRPFLRFCRRRRRAWQSVDDEFLILWRERLRRTHEADVDRINTCLTTIFAFYIWAEENGRLRFRVGCYLWDGEAPTPAASMPVFAISASPVFNKRRHGRVLRGWTTPLTLSRRGKAPPFRHTPTEAEISRLHEITLDRAHGERDTLILSWAEEAGPRRAEILRIGKSHMPTLDQLAELIELDATWTIEVKRKGGKTMALRATPDLIIRTLDFIDFGRQAIVDQCQAKLVGYREPDEVFLSSTTGMVLTADTVTKICSLSFRQAGIARASLQRLRARFAVRTIESLVDAIFSGDIQVGSESSWVETILDKAAELMGHSSPASLRPYLNYVLNRRLQQSDAMKANRQASRLRLLQLQVSVWAQRVSQEKDLHTAAMFIKDGKKDQAAAKLRQVASSLEAEVRLPNCGVPEP